MRKATAMCYVAADAVACFPRHRKILLSKLTSDRFLCPLSLSFYPPNLFAGPCSWPREGQVGWSGTSDGWCWLPAKLLIYFVYLHALPNWHRKLAVLWHCAQCHMCARDWSKQGCSFLSMKDGCCRFRFCRFLSSLSSKQKRDRFPFYYCTSIRHTHTLDEWDDWSEQMTCTTQFYDLYHTGLCWQAGWPCPVVAVDCRLLSPLADHRSSPSAVQLTPVSLSCPLVLHSLARVGRACCQHRCLPSPSPTASLWPCCSLLSHVHCVPPQWSRSEPCTPSFLLGLELPEADWPGVQWPTFIITSWLMSGARWVSEKLWVFNREAHWAVLKVKK